MVLENNPKLKNYDDVKEGQSIKVPSVFGKKITFYVDKRTYLPMVQIVYDDKGLYNRIEYSSCVINPVFREEDFSRKNRKYGF
jgi:outer membrane lipoprotein-sorting protein